MTVTINTGGMEAIPEDEQCTIQFRDINFSVKQSVKRKKTEKVILQGVTGLFRPGRTCAVMGASGAGKTSLLQILAGEVRFGSVSGDLRVNSKVIHGSDMKKISAFVFQDDVILSTMTVREAITMSAKLRLPESLSMEDKNLRVNEVIELMHLEKAQHTRIGDSENKGISGGERKRCAMAMELITNPYILFLDEPTSGLDSFTAFSVVRTLRDLAQTGRTVVTTIHQPSSDVFHMFDDLLLLSEGQVMYQGEAAGAINYFSKLGFECPTFVNPADFLFMSILNNEESHLVEDSEKSSGEEVVEGNRERIARLLDSWTQSSESKQIRISAHAAIDKEISTHVFKGKSNFWTQFVFLFNRASKNAFRNPLIIQSSLGQTLFLGIIIGLLFLNTDEVQGLPAIQNYAGVLFFLAINNIFQATIGVLSIFGAEKQVFSREEGAGYYSLAAYFLSKIMVEIPFQILFPWIGGSIIYFMTGMRLDARIYFITQIFIVLSSSTGFALGILFASIFKNLPTALAIAPLCLLPMMLFSGLFINSENIPVYFDWIKYLSPMKYSFEGMFKVQMEGLLIPNGDDDPITGEEAIEQFGFAGDGLTVLVCAMVLLGMVLFFIMVAYFGLLKIVKDQSRPISIKRKEGVLLTIEEEEKATLEVTQTSSEHTIL